MKPIIQVVLSISSIQHCKKIATLLIFFNYTASVWKLSISVEGGRKHLFQEVDVVKNKNLEDVTVEQLQVEARCIVQQSGFEETGEG